MQYIYNLLIYDGQDFWGARTDLIGSFTSRPKAEQGLKKWLEFNDYNLADVVNDDDLATTIRLVKSPIDGLSDPADYEVINIRYLYND